MSQAKQGVQAKQSSQARQAQQASQWCRIHTWSACCLKFSSILFPQFLTVSRSCVSMEAPFFDPACFTPQEFSAWAASQLQQMIHHSATLRSNYYCKWSTKEACLVAKRRANIFCCRVRASTKHKLSSAAGHFAGLQDHQQQ